MSNYKRKIKIHLHYPVKVNLNLKLKVKFPHLIFRNQVKKFQIITPTCLLKVLTSKHDRVAIKLYNK